jgi:riboflavin kinase/FMN adenylyltransferase
MRRPKFLDQTALQGSYVTVGSFDGVHRGHRNLLQQMLHAAREDHAPAVAVTLFPHPRSVLAGGSSAAPFRYLATLEERIALLESIGLDAVITQPFDEEFSRLQASAFLEMLKDRLGMRALWCGPGFTFGFEREGNIAYLQQHSVSMGFMAYVIPPLMGGSEPVSSSRIRQTLAAGNLETAERFLGRPYTLSGKVVHGAGRGRSIGFPTANLSPWPEILVPASGIYATYVRLQDGRHESVTSIGVRPTFETGGAPATTIETYLLDFEADLYGAGLQLEFRARLRDERRFDSTAALHDQILRDIDQARSIFKEVQ